MHLFYNKSQNNTDKNFNSIPNTYNNKLINNSKQNNQIYINLNFNKNLNNLTQQSNPKTSNKFKNKEKIDILIKLI